MPQSLTNLLVHIVFSTKNREPLIADEIAPELHAYIAGICARSGGKPIRINGMSDHVHVLTYIPSTVAIATTLRDIKSGSSKWVHQTRSIGTSRGRAVMRRSASANQIWSRYETTSPISRPITGRCHSRRNIARFFNDTTCRLTSGTSGTEITPPCAALSGLTSVGAWAAIVPPRWGEEHVRALASDYKWACTIQCMTAD